MAPLSGSLKARESSPTYLDRHKADHRQTGYNAVSLLCLVFVAYMATIRIRQYRKARIVYPTRVLASATYMTIMVYIIVLNMLATGAGLHSFEMCKVAIYTCLVFYGTVKGLLLYFMAERVRTVRSMTITRKQDKLWMSCIFVITMGLSGVIVAALCRANYAVDDNGTCNVGIPDGQTVAVFLFDGMANLWLTGAFLWLLRPILQEHAELQGSGQMSSIVRRLFRIKRRNSSNVDNHSTPQLRSNRFHSTGEAVSTEQLTSNTFHSKPKEQKDDLTVQESTIPEDTTHRSDSDVQLAHVATPSTLADLSHQSQMLKDDDDDIHSLLEPLEPISFQDVASATPRNEAAHTTEQESTIRRLDKLVKKSIIGTFLLFAPCIANATMFWYFAGYEPAWLCLTACSIDVTTAAAVLHWLTENGEDDA